MKKIILTALTTLFAGFLITSCYDPIFQSIRAEVSLNNADISGFINTLIPFTTDKNDDGVAEDLLFLQNGSIYYKEATNTSHGSWKKDKSKGLPESISYSYFDNEFDGYNFIKLAADKDFLYALCYKAVFDDDNNRNVPKEMKLYCLEGSTGIWKENETVSKYISNYIDKLYTKNYMMDASIHLFDNNETEFKGTDSDKHLITGANRNAYIRIGGGRPYETGEKPNLEYGSITAGATTGNYGILKLQGLNPPVEIAEDTNGASIYTLSAINVSGTDYFTNYLTAQKSKNHEDYVYVGIDKKLFTIPASKISQTVNIIDGETTKPMNRLNAYNCKKEYYIDSGKTEKSKVSLDAMTIEGIDIEAIYERKTEGCADDIISIAETSDFILMGTYEKGAYHAALSTSGIPAEKTSDFTTNCDDILIEPYIVRMMFCVDPSKMETEAVLYSSLQFRYTQSNAGTNYTNVGLWSYYPKRGNWNRE